MVYADNAATTKICPEARAAMLEAMDSCYGNPSSLHRVGQQAAAALGRARESIARSLGGKPDEIYFTSGGSESDNQAILSGALNGAAEGKRHIITSAFEHHAVLHTLKKLEDMGYSVTYLDVHADGHVRPEELEAAIREDTALVTVMTVNNELGTIQPIGELGAICRARGIPFHTDAVQAAGHIPLDVKQADMLSLSAHKFHGPRGIGVLYARRGLRLHSLIEGGGQERGKRAGTENLPAIAGMAAALETAMSTMETDMKRVAAMRQRLLEGLSRIPHSRINGGGDCAPGILNLSFEGVEGESLLLLLDGAGICASSGSACASGSLEPSHVLLAMGLPTEIARGSLRLSIDGWNTEQEIDTLLTVIPQVVQRLRSMNAHYRACENGESSFLLK